MVARHDAAQASLMAQLKARRIKKTYLALVHGSVSAAVGRIEAPIGRDPKHRTRMAVVPDGRPSITGYRVTERFAAWTLLELDLVTGRTHQIRVHLEAIGHPVAGDRVYGTGTSRRGPDGLARLFLHAWRLELASPADGRLIRATAPLPDELEDVLATLRGSDDEASGRGHALPKRAES
jgi:23S rRNA pseudouridine1911/1915/1917 synthase